MKKEEQTSKKLKNQTARENKVRFAEPDAQAYRRSLLLIVFIRQDYLK